MPLGSGADSVTLVSALGPAPVDPFPLPRFSNPACRGTDRAYHFGASTIFPARRSHNLDVYEPVRMSLSSRSAFGFPADSPGSPTNSPDRVTGSTLVQALQVEPIIGASYSNTHQSRGISATVATAPLTMLPARRSGPAPKLPASAEQVPQRPQCVMGHPVPVVASTHASTIRKARQHDRKKLDPRTGYAGRASLPGASRPGYGRCSSLATEIPGA